VQRRNRLSRSRDFDAVYRQGRSVSTRFLVLYWFKRDDEEAGEPRLGLAVTKGVGNAVVRNKMKRQLREVWRARLESIPVANDYVLVAKPGLPDAVEAHGFDWLGARVDEVLGKALGGREAQEPGREPSQEPNQEPSHEQSRGAA
jgi:ribonuclease P protein component